MPFPGRRHGSLPSQNTVYMSLDFQLAYLKWLAAFSSCSSQGESTWLSLGYCLILMATPLLDCGQCLEGCCKMVVPMKLCGIQEGMVPLSFASSARIYLISSQRLLMQMAPTCSAAIV